MELILDAWLILFYLDPVWDNGGTKVVAVRKMIDGPQNIVIISVEEK